MTGGRVDRGALAGNRQGRERALTYPNSLRVTVRGILTAGYGSPVRGSLGRLGSLVRSALSVPAGSEVKHGGASGNEFEPSDSGPARRATRAREQGRPGQLCMVHDEGCLLLINGPHRCDAHGVN